MDLFDKLNNLKRKVASLRRFVNDSVIGNYVNNSVPGILVEGSSRVLYDVKLDVKYLFLDMVGYVGEKLCGGKGLDLSITRGLEEMVDEIEEQMPEYHYSHKSQLYDENVDDKGYKFMKRVSVSDALLLKSSSSKLALLLTYYVLKPENKDTESVKKRNF